MEAAAKTELGAAIAKAEDGALVSGVNGIFAVLKKHGLLREVVIEPDYVGVHHMNRDGFGISVQDAHDLMSHILGIGWASEQCAPVACEVPPAEAEHAFDFNCRLAALSGSMLPAIQKHNLKFLSLSGSHTNAGLRAIRHGCLSRCDNLTQDGKMSLQRIATRDPTFGEVCRTGLRWRVIAHEAMTAFPSMALLVQAALNTSGQLARGEHELQILQRILNAVNQAQNLDGPLWKHFVLKYR